MYKDCRVLLPTIEMAECIAKLGKRANIPTHSAGIQSGYCHFIHKPELQFSRIVGVARNLGSIITFDEAVDMLLEEIEKLHKPAPKPVLPPKPKTPVFQTFYVSVPCQEVEDLLKKLSPHREFLELNQAFPKDGGFYSTGTFQFFKHWVRDPITLEAAIDILKEERK